MVRLPVAAGLAAEADRRGKQDDREGWEPLVYHLMEVPSRLYAEVPVTFAVVI